MLLLIFAGPSHFRIVFSVSSAIEMIENYFSDKYRFSTSEVYFQVQVQRSMEITNR